ncbi:hypothetical protein PGT21_028219 [Puccinia graminis f. sp. tritici]|uniref:Uncharacterized protein n=1 Tax=Puccinia graminis f. sp. tritici TaxID=56615 RepID=A0A5B0NDL2_PUCGR|nr:hypothetical protein PGT21_028219 [Puccinia graminis f. sp. tritici]
MHPPKIDSSISYLALWYWYLSQQQEDDNTVYIRASRVAFKRPVRWEPWNDTRIPMVRFVEFFRMTVEDFRWLSDQLSPELQQDPLRRGDPLSVEAQVAVGLYRLAHGVCYVTIGHVFNIGKETAEKASGRFVNAVLRILRDRTVGYV